MISKILILVILLTPLFAKNTPYLFSLLGDKLYDANVQFESFSNEDSLHDKIYMYNSECELLRQHGLYLESKKNLSAEERNEYLKSLRLLEKEYIAIMHVLQQMVLKSINQNDYNTFARLSNSALVDLWQSPTIADESISYYQKNKDKGEISSLERLIHTKLFSKLPDTTKTHTGVGVYVANDSSQPNIMWQDNEDVIRLKMSWEKGIEYCRELELDGYNDWLLPDKHMLFTLFFDEPAFHYLVNDLYWSSSESSYDNAWRVYFKYGSGKNPQGNMTSNLKSDEWNIRCYRKIK